MNADHFALRHTGPRPEEIPAMLKKIGVDSLDALITKTIPSSILLREKLPLKEGISEHAYLNNLREIASRNKQFKTYIGMGYYGTIMPAVIQRNILENPGGTPPIHLIRLRSHRADSKPCLIFRPWSWN